MKKRVVAMLLAGMMTVSLAACGGGSDSGSDDKKKESKKSDMKVAMVTDSGDITDQSFNQTTYEARNASVDQAIADGANVVVLPGYMFAAAVVSQSEMYPDV